MQKVDRETRKRIIQKINDLFEQKCSQCDKRRLDELQCSPCPILNRLNQMGATLFGKDEDQEIKRPKPQIRRPANKTIIKNQVNTMARAYTKKFETTEEQRKIAHRNGIGYKTLINRISRYGWSVEDAITKKPQPRPNKQEVR